jgi:hypothetical protein
MPEMQVDEVTAFEEETLRSTLQAVDDAGRSVIEVVPHRLDRAIDASVVSHTRASDTPSLTWKVVRSSGYGQDLAATLQSLSDEGWTIFAIIPHRIKTENFPEVIAHRAQQVGS